MQVIAFIAAGIFFGAGYFTDRLGSKPWHKLLALVFFIIFGFLYTAGIILLAQSGNSPRPGS